MKKALFLIMAFVLTSALVLSCGPAATPSPSPTPVFKPTPPATQVTLPPPPAATPKTTPKPTPEVKVTPAPKAAQLPRSISLATHSVGSVFYAVGSGLASVLTKNSGMEVVVAPHPGPVAWVDKMAAGELEIGMVNEAEVRWMFDGAEAYKPRGPSPQVRMLRIGHLSEQGVVVAAISSIKTLADLKGKRWAWPVAGHVSYTNQGLQVMAQAGFTEKDIISVPAESFSAAGRLLVEGKAEVFFAGPESAQVREIIEAKGGIRYIPMYTDPKSLEVAAKIHPGRLTYLQPGRPGVTEPTPAWSFDAYMAGWSTLPDAVAYQVVKTLWEHYDELAPIHVELKKWSPERSIAPGFSVPVHPGAIKFYKEKGVWTQEMDKLQEKLLSGK